MAVPWTGVPMARLVMLAQPKPEAKYIRLETFMDPDIAPASASPGTPGRMWKA